MTDIDTPSTLRLGLPKGRMHDGVLRLLADAGVEVSASSRGYRPRIGLPGIEAKILKPQNIIEMLHAGSRDFGFAGADWVAELGYDAPSSDGLIELLDTGLDRVRLVVAAPKDAVLNGTVRLPEGRPLRIAAEMPSLASRWIESRGINATVVRTYGATEVFPPEDADCIVDIAASGDTLRANGLEVIDTIMSSSTRLFASRTAYEDTLKRAAIDRMVVLLRSVLEARRRVMLDLNVASEALDAVVEALPCMREPTVSPLRGSSGYAVRAAVPRDRIAEIIPQLQARGATDLVVSRPTQIVR
ncbi:MAG: ATP phosphoribosyltransferase [Phycisphaerales bacterium]